MKKYKNLLVLILLISIFICVGIIAQTYAKYLSSASGSSNINVASWNIKVNNQSIINNSNISDTITPIFPGNDYIASGIIAPTAEGYFDLNFDFTDVDVSFSYKISTSVDESSDVKDLIVTGYSIDDGEIINSNEDITSNILYSDNISTRKIRIYIKWDDSDTATMNNVQDTSTANSGKALFDINISFIQLAI